MAWQKAPMIRLLAPLILAGCGGLAYSTTVADTPAARLAMAQSVWPGWTTETAFVARWGLPVQKIREGGETRFVYRDIRNPAKPLLPQWGNSADYVIVTFQNGLATGVATSDGIACRATFTPRPPGYGFDDPSVVGLVGECPLAAFLDGEGGGDGAGAMIDGSAPRSETTTSRPPIRDHDNLTGGKSLK